MTPAEMMKKMADLEARALAAEKQLQAVAAAASDDIRVDRRTDKNGKEWIGVKGIAGTGWGISAEPRGWQVFLAKFDSTIRPMIENQLKQPVKFAG